MKKNPLNTFTNRKDKSKLKKVKILKNDSNKIFERDFEILKECRNFCQNLYTKFKTCNKTQNQLLQNIPKAVTIEQNETLTNPIAKKEIKEGIFQMENQKSPGIDGIPIEFYKDFHTYKEQDLLQLYNNILQNEKETTTTMKQVIIRLIPGKGDLQKLH